MLDYKKEKATKKGLFQKLAIFPNLSGDTNHESYYRNFLKLYLIVAILLLIISFGYFHANIWYYSKYPNSPFIDIDPDIIELKNSIPLYKKGLRSFLNVFKPINRILNDYTEPLEEEYENEEEKMKHELLNTDYPEDLFTSRNLIFNNSKFDTNYKIKSYLLVAEGPRSYHWLENEPNKTLPFMCLCDSDELKDYLKSDYLPKDKKSHVNCDKNKNVAITANSTCNVYHILPLIKN